MKKFIIALAVSALFLGVYGCKKADTTAEDVEKKVDQTVEKVDKAGEAVKDVVKEVKK